MSKAIERSKFESYVELIPFHQCWEWVGARFQSSGYGRFWANGRSLLAHRVAYELAKGAIPEGGIVMHSCDNKGCVRPDHLSIGTSKDNTADMMSKGRAGFVSHKTHLAKLNHEMVAAIRAEYTRTISPGGRTSSNTVALQKKYGVGRSTIHAIVSRRCWVDY